MERTDQSLEYAPHPIGEMRFWLILWFMSLMVISCTYLSPFFFEWLSLRVFIREFDSLSDVMVSWNRFWKSLVVPHCFFSGFVSVFFLQARAEVALRPLKTLALAIIGYIAFLVTLEIAQIFIPGRTVSGGDIIIHFISVFTGVILGEIYRRSLQITHKRIHFALKCFSVWLFLLIYLSIYPMTFKEGKDQALLGRLIDSIGVTPRKGDTVANFLLGWPGAWIALNLLKSTELNKGFRFLRHGTIVLLVVSICALCVETMQYHFAERFPSLYDVIFQALGALIASGVYILFGYEEKLNMNVLLKQLEHLTSRHVMMIAFLLAFVCFEWIPWFPSIELSSLRDGLRELSVALSDAEYPWDLHWYANWFGTVAMIFCSALAGLAFNAILQDRLKPSLLREISTFTLCFYGVAVEFGKVFVSTKNATPILVVASICGGLSAVLIIVFSKILHGMQGSNKTSPKKDVLL